MEKVNILWADDEIDLLKPYVLFLQEKGFEVTTTNNGNGAIELVQKIPFDLIFLDENMPGKSGLETLAVIKNIKPSVPVIMITKSEEEFIMEEAIGSKIADYLIKPVNPNQILLSIKKTLETRRLVSEKTNSTYQQEFRSLGMKLSEKLDHVGWAEVYKKLVYWELELEKSRDAGMYEVLTMQKTEANHVFSKFIESHYLHWLKYPEQNAPVMSNTVFRKKILPVVEGCQEPVFFLLIDNLRYDQWKMLEPVIAEYFDVTGEESYYSILPTATQYARNAIFAGLMPLDIEARLPKLWLNDEEEGGKNMHEAEFLADQLQRIRRTFKHSYQKVTNFSAGKELVESISNLMQNKLNVIVYNFVDMLSHARTEMEMIRELAEDESAYRSITRSWFEHSPLFEAIKRISDKKVKIIISTDHGTIRVKNPVKIVGDKNTNTNLRYKQGKSLSYDKKEVFEIKNPTDAMLPRTHVSSAFVFAREDMFFAYPNNYNHYVSYYRNTFQHGGVSLEEMIIPFVTLKSR